MLCTARYNILHLIPLFEIGGLQRQIANWVAHDGIGNRHFLGILNYSTEGLVLFKKDLALLFNGSNQGPETLIKTLVAHRVQIIVAHNWAAWDKAVMIIERLPSCRLFFVAHGRQLHVQQEHQAQFLSRISHNSVFTEKIVCTSKFLESMLHGFLPQARKKIITVYNGVAADGLDNGVTRARAKTGLGIPSERFVAGTVTRLAPEKNLQFLMRALDLLVRQGKKNILLLILGNGKDAASLRDAVSDFKLHDYVRFEPAIEAVGAYYSAFDLYVNCSVFESCSMAILEAMSYGLPVLAPMVGGVGELITNGEVGLLYPPDDLSAFVEKFDPLYRSCELRDALGSKAREYVTERFGLEKMIHEYQRLFAAPASGEGVL